MLNQVRNLTEDTKNRTLPDLKYIWIVCETQDTDDCFWTVKLYSTITTHWTDSCHILYCLIGHPWTLIGNGFVPRTGIDLSNECSLSQRRKCEHLKDKDRPDCRLLRRRTRPFLAYCDSSLDKVSFYYYFSLTGR